VNRRLVETIRQYNKPLRGGSSLMLITETLEKMVYLVVFVQAIGILHLWRWRND